MDFYLIIIIILFVAAFADLIVGISNDAVNFLNSALGSNAAKRITIMCVASLGVLFGTTFSSGIMEVARKGIFNPEMYVFHEVMIIFLGVMITDIILLDFYNTYALPTSTTVSIVFEILGGAVAIALLNIMQQNSSFTLVDYINTGSVFKIVSSIGLSIFFSFIFGYLIQLIVRLWFTFNYKNTINLIGPIFGGISSSVISYFLLIKGLKGSSIITELQKLWIQENFSLIIVFGFFAFTIFYYFLSIIFKVNILKVTVLLGTFALALAFAANDLVNFIGAPLGALASYNIANSIPNLDPYSFLMTDLSKKVNAENWILVIAGLIMVATLWMSKKARSVTETEINLGRQNQGFERFGSSMLARNLVKFGIQFSALLKKIFPKNVVDFFTSRINPNDYPQTKNPNEQPAFDMVRASVNLVVASALVSVGTSLKLPLSTTFVTFSVAMATSLADKAWGRESAVYRINGVLTVFGGWFLTAFLAFSTCFIFTLLIYYFEMIAIIILLIIAAYYYYTSNKIHTKRVLEQSKKVKEKLKLEQSLTKEEVLISTFDKLIIEVDRILINVLKGVNNEKIKSIKKAKDSYNDVYELKSHIIGKLVTIDNKNSSSENNYENDLRVLSNIEEFLENINQLVNESYDYIDNNKPPLSKKTKKNLSNLISLFKEGFINEISSNDNLREEISSQIKNSIVEELKSVKKNKTKIKPSYFFISIMTKVEKILLKINDVKI